MNSKQILRDIMIKNEISLTVLASRMGMIRQNVWSRINGDTTKEMNLNLLKKFLRCMDYKLVIMPVEKRVPDGCYEVGEEEVIEK